MDLARSQRLLAVLRQRSPQTAAQLMQALGVSQPALSRLIAADEQVLRIGRARASRYVLARAVGRAGWRWPLYCIDVAGRAHGLGELRALHADAFHFEPAQALPALLRGEFAQGLFPGLPWFMDDLRPQGFLGRGFAR
ncbi:HipA domain protein, partial [mine drainage metagenome]